MTFFTFLKSLDELLYEVISWLIFWPRTFWRALSRPREMMTYADDELADKPAEQYKDTLRPPLFLLLTILLSHAIEVALIGVSPIIADTAGLAGLIDNDTNLVLLRVFLFASLPLILAVRMVRRSGKPVDRDTLRPPFYSQCYVAAPFALGMGLAGTFAQMHWTWAPLAALVAVAVSFAWYGALQIGWFKRHLRESTGRAIVDASIAMAECVAMLVVVTALFG